MLVISPYNRPGTIHRFTNTTDALRTMEEILGLNSLSQFDYYGRPLDDVFSDSPDFSPFTRLVPSVYASLDLEIEDSADEDRFSRVLWRAIKGERVPYPGPTRMSALEFKRSN